MRHDRRALGPLMIIILSAPAMLPAATQSVLLTPAEVPSLCRIIPGIFPLGEKTRLLFEYDEYSAALPAYLQKQAQSLDCGGQKGSLFYFGYSSQSERDSTLLFAKPVLASQQGLARELPIVLWNKGFVVVSFKDAPAELLGAVEKKCAGFAPAAPQRASAPPAAPPRPSSETRSTVQPVPVNAPIPRPDQVRKPIPVSAPTKPPSPPPPAPGRSAALEPDVASAVPNAFSVKLGCDAAGIQSQVQSVCDILREFASGKTPELPFQVDIPWIGPTYTLDSYGRLTDMHYDALIGLSRAEEVSFVAYTSASGSEDFQIKSLVDARQAHQDLPANEVLQKIRELAARKRYAINRTAGPSILIKPGGARRIYVRQSGNHLVLVAPSGSTPEEQNKSTLVVAILY